jgi:hypothetical protein
MEAASGHTTIKLGKKVIPTICHLAAKLPLVWPVAEVLGENYDVFAKVSSNRQEFQDLRKVVEFSAEWLEKSLSSYLDGDNINALKIFLDALKADLDSALTLSSMS